MASGSSTCTSLCHPRSPNACAASFRPGCTWPMPVQVLRTIGSKAYTNRATSAGPVPMLPSRGIIIASRASDGIGLQLVAAADAIDVQAQADTLALQARDDVQVVSAGAHVDWSAAKSIKLATAGGASIVIDGGNIVVSCPGKLTIHAGKKSFSGPASMGAEMPQLPRGTMRFDEKFQLLDPAGDPVRNMRYAITKANGARIEGVTDASGMIPLQQGFSPEDLKIQILASLRPSKKSQSASILSLYVKSAPYSSVYGS
eukprot:gene23495-26598_t